MAYQTNPPVNTPSDLEKLSELDLVNFMIFRGLTRIIPEGPFKGESALFWALSKVELFYDNLRKNIAEKPLYLDTIIKPQDFTEIITEGPFKGHSALFCVLWGYGATYDALRKILAGKPLYLKTIITSKAFTEIIPQGEFEGQSALFSTLCQKNVLCSALREHTQDNPAYLNTIIEAPAFTKIIPKGELKGHSALFHILFGEGIFYDALRKRIADNSLYLKRIITSKAFIEIISSESEFKGNSALFQALFRNNTLSNALIDSIAKTPDYLKTIIESRAFIEVIPQGESKGQSALSCALIGGTTHHNTLRNSIADKPVYLKKIIESPAFTEIISEGSFKGESALFYALFGDGIFYDALKKIIADNTVYLKKIIESPAFIEIIPQGRSKGQSALIWMLCVAKPVYDNLRNSIANTKEFLKRIIESPAFTEIIPEGELKGKSALFYALSRDGMLYNALRNSIAETPSCLKTIITSKAFIEIIHEGTLKGLSVLFWVLIGKSVTHDALRKKIAKESDYLKKIIESRTFTEIIREGKFKGQSPLFLALSIDGILSDALINSIAENTVYLNTIIEAPAFIEIIRESESKGQSVLFWALVGKSVTHNALRKRIANNKNYLNKIIEAPAFIEIISEGQINGSSALYYALERDNILCKALRNSIADNPVYLKKVIKSQAFNNTIMFGDFKGNTLNQLVMSKKLQYCEYIRKKIALLASQETYQHSLNAISRLNDGLKGYLGLSQCHIVSRFSSDECSFTIKATDIFHLNILEKLCRVLKLLTSTQPEQRAEGFIEKTYPLAILQTPAQFNFQELPPIKEFYCFFEHTLGLIRYFCDAMYSTPWEKFAVTCRLKILPDSLLSLQAEITNFPSAIENQILSVLDLPDEPISLTRMQIEKWFEYFLQKCMDVSLEFEENAVLRKTFVSLTLPPSSPFKINKINRTDALKESLRECFLSPNIQSINDDIKNNLAMLQQMTLELDKKCYSTLASLLDKDKKDTFNQETLLELFAPPSHETWEPLAGEINTIINTAAFIKQESKVKGDLLSKIKNLKQDLTYLLEVSNFSAYYAEYVNRLIQHITQFHKHCQLQTQNLCSSITTEQKRILRSVVITSEHEKNLKALNEEIVNSRQYLTSNIFSFLKDKQIHILQQRYEQLKKMSAQQHVKILQDNWEKIKEDSFFKDCCKTPKVVQLPVAPIKNEAPRVNVTTQPTQDYAARLAALQAQEEREFLEEQRRIRDSKAQKADALERERRSAKQPPSTTRVTVTSTQSYPHVYPVVINTAVTQDVHPFIHATTVAMTQPYQPYFNFLHQHLSELMAQNQTLQHNRNHLINAYGFLVALLSLLSETTLYTDSLPAHTEGLMHLKTFASHLCHAELVDVVETCVLSEAPARIPFFQGRLQLIWQTLNESWGCSMPQHQYLNASALLPLIENYTKLEKSFSSVLNKHRRKVFDFLKQQRIIREGEVLVNEEADITPAVQSEYRQKLTSTDMMLPISSFFASAMEDCHANVGALFALSLFVRELDRISLYLKTPLRLIPLEKFNYHLFANNLRHPTNINASTDFVAENLRVLMK